MGLNKIEEVDTCVDESYDCSINQEAPNSC
jgi:hypothetical protein